MVNIYTLSDPRNNQVRYVGKTTGSLSNRLAKHFYVNGNRHNDNWIKSLRSVGLRPVIELVDTVSDENWEFEEKFYISYFRYLGLDLTNLAEGGIGTLGVKNTESQKKKCLETKIKNGTKRKITPNHRAKLMAGFAAKIARIGSCHTDSERQKIVANRSERKGWKIGENGINNIQKANSNPIVQYDKIGNLIEIHASVGLAAKKLSTDRTNLSYALNGKQKFAKGFIWKYATEEQKERLKKQVIKQF